MMQLTMTLLAGAVAIAIPAASAAQDAPATPAADAAAQPATAPPAEAAPQAQAVASRKATKDDLKVDAAVVDAKGDPVGKIEKVTATGAVVATGTVRAELALSSFAMGDKGLVIAMSKAELEAAAKAKAPAADAKTDGQAGDAPKG